MYTSINKLISVVLFVFLITGATALAQTYTEGNSYFGRNNYIEYICGGLPLIISAPHGGDETPSEIPDRTCGTTVTDSYTMQLSQEIRDAVFALSGRYPHVIINHLKRIKLDANRDMDEATCGDPEAEIAWEEYHKFIDSAKVAITDEYSKGLFIDLHGQSSHGERIELGYLISGSELQLSDSELNTATYQDKSSIRNLISNNIGGISFSELLRGPKAFGTLIDDADYAVIPSMYYEYPTDAFYSGGYNTDRHGSKSGGTIDAIQIECNREIRFVEYKRLDFADDLAEILLAYLKEHYFANLEDYYDPSLGKDDLLISDGISYFPNPVSDILHLRVVEALDLEIYNLYGQEVYSEFIGADKDLSLSHLGKGLYLMVFKRNGVVLTQEKLLIAPGL